MTVSYFRHVWLAVAICGAISAPTAGAQSAVAPTSSAPAQTLINNARIFDSRSDQLADGINMLVEGNLI